MKKILILAFLSCIMFYTGAQDSYIMYETMYIKPKADKMEEFEKALSAHNKKYHSEGPSKVFIRFVVNGPHSGEYVWTMGPTTWTDLDNRPDGDAHKEDWNGVLPYIEDISEVEYWRMSDDLSYFPEDYIGSPKIHIRAWDVKTGKWDEFKAFLKQVVAVYTEKDYPNPWMVYINQFQTGNGRDIAGVFGFEKWAEYDIEGNWVEDFDEIHGEGAWETSMELVGEISTMIEEVRELVPELSGSAQ